MTGFVSTYSLQWNWTSASQNQLTSTKCWEVTAICGWLQPPLALYLL